MLPPHLKFEPCTHLFAHTTWFELASSITQGVGLFTWNRWMGSCFRNKFFELFSNKAEDFKPTREKCLADHTLPAKHSRMSHPLSATHDFQFFQKWTQNNVFCFFFTWKRPLLFPPLKFMLVDRRAMLMVNEYLWYKATDLCPFRGVSPTNQTRIRLA